MQPHTPLKPPRLPYTKPVLRVFGSVRALTRLTGLANPTADGGTGKGNKT
jgi:hypothetical protein